MACQADLIDAAHWLFVCMATCLYVHLHNRLYACVPSWQACQATFFVAPQSYVVCSFVGEVELEQKLQKLVGLLLVFHLTVG